MRGHLPLNDPHVSSRQGLRPGAAISDGTMIPLVRGNDPRGPQDVHKPQKLALLRQGRAARSGGMGMCL
jgi:hypothetical protein